MHYRRQRKLRIKTFDTDYIKPDETIEFLTNGMCVYNYRGNNFKLFKNREDVYKFLTERDFSLVIKEFCNEKALNKYLKKLE